MGGRQQQQSSQGSMLSSWDGKREGGGGLLSPGMGAMSPGMTAMSSIMGVSPRMGGLSPGMPPGESPVMPPLGGEEMRGMHGHSMQPPPLVPRGQGSDMREHGAMLTGGAKPSAGFGYGSPGGPVDGGWDPHDRAQGAAGGYVALGAERDAGRGYGAGGGGGGGRGAEPRWAHDQAQGMGGMAQGPLLTAAACAPARRPAGAAPRERWLRWVGR
jgi:hypothetical protein